MRLTDQETEKILKFVKEEPRTIQEVSRFIKRSWITTEKYVKHISARTGLISIKTFRQGSQAALKIAYPITKQATFSDDLKQDLANQLMTSRHERDFDFMEIFQFIPSSGKKVEYEKFSRRYLLEDKQLISLCESANEHLLIFSGNLSILGVYYAKKTMVDVIENLLRQGVYVKILTRINVSSLSNIDKIKTLLAKYPEKLEIRHRYQPLRGFIVDSSICRFKNDETLSDYRKGELRQNTRVFYEVSDKQWLAWLEKIFWSMYATSISYNQRAKEINNIFR